MNKRKNVSGYELRNNKNGSGRSWQRVSKKASKTAPIEQNLADISSVSEVDEFRLPSSTEYENSLAQYAPDKMLSTEKIDRSSEWKSVGGRESFKEAIMSDLGVYRSEAIFNTVNNIGGLDDRDVLFEIVETDGEYITEKLKEYNKISVMDFDEEVRKNIVKDIVDMAKESLAENSSEVDIDEYISHDLPQRIPSDDPSLIREYMNLSCKSNIMDNSSEKSLRSVIIKFLD